MTFAAVLVRTMTPNETMEASERARERSDQASWMEGIVIECLPGILLGYNDVLLSIIIYCFIIDDLL